LALCCWREGGAGEAKAQTAEYRKKEVSLNVLMGQNIWLVLIIIFIVLVVLGVITVAV